MESEQKSGGQGKPMNLREMLRFGEEYLAEHDIADASSDAWLLMEHVTGLSRAQYLARATEPLEEICRTLRATEPLEKIRRTLRATEPLERIRRTLRATGPTESACGIPQAWEKMGTQGQNRSAEEEPETGAGSAENMLLEYQELLEQRAFHIPLQHLTGEQEFMGLPFLVNGHVLIPRQDTETLAEEALKRLRPGMRVLDLCTGSGCIAVSLAKLGPEINVEASDISREALAVARENARRLGARVAFTESDLFAGISGKYHMIVSNPPYVRTSVIAELAEEVRLHEPLQALDGSEDGLHFYREIVLQSPAYLEDGGWLLFEIGYDQAEAVSALMAEAGFAEIEVIRDLAGNDRVVVGRWKLQL